MQRTPSPKQCVIPFQLRIALEYLLLPPSSGSVSMRRPHRRGRIGTIFLFRIDNRVRQAAGCSGVLRFHTLLKTEPRGGPSQITVMPFCQTDLTAAAMPLSQVTIMSRPHPRQTATRCSFKPYPSAIRSGYAHPHRHRDLLSRSARIYVAVIPSMS